MVSKKITLYDTNDDRDELIELLPKTVVTQIYDETSSKFLNESLNDIKNSISNHTSTSNTNAHLASNISIVDSASNFTSNTVEGALSELFTSASEGKQGLSTALAGKGQTVSPEAPFSNFVDAINNISTGNKFARGFATRSTTTGTFTLANGSVNNGLYKFTVSGLDFTPAYIIIIFATSGNTVAHSTIYSSYGDILTDVPDSKILTATPNRGGSSYSNNIFIVNSGDAIVNYGTFTLPINGGVPVGSNIRWVAFE